MHIIVLVLFSFSTLLANLLEDTNISAILKNETAFYVDDHNEDIMKFENSIHLFLDTVITTESLIHMELKLIYNSKNKEGYKTYHINTKHDFLQALYLDSNRNGVSMVEKYHKRL
jgi:hypothetical protein